MFAGHVHIQIRFSVERFATKATSPKVDPIMKFGQFLGAEHIAGEMEGTLIWHFHIELLEDRPPNCLNEMTDNR